ncbi:MAG: heavy-metal-associated domain-containing protein [Tannerellaceae bacterium]
MKNLKTIVAIAFVALFSVSPLFASDKKEKKAKQKEVVVYTMALHGAHCENIIMKNIPFEKGVEDVKASAKTQTVTVTYRNDKTNKDALVKAFNKLGYDAQEVKPEQPATQEQKTN